MLLPLRESAVVIVSLLCLVIAGCGGGGATINGKVTLDGKPAPGAEIMFQSQGDEKVICYGYGNADGTYAVDYGGHKAMPVGPCKIEVQHYLDPKTGEALPNTEEGNALRNNGAAKKHVSFQRDLTAGSNTIDLEIAEGEPIE